MSCNQDKLLPIRKTIGIIAGIYKCSCKLFVQRVVILNLINYPIQSVNNSVSGYYDFIFGDPFRQKVGFTQWSRSKIIFSDSTGDLTIHLFRPRGIYIMGAQTRLNMSNRNLLIKCCKCRRC